MKSMFKFFPIAVLFFTSANIFSQGTWTQKADLSGASKRRSCASFVIGTKAYVGTGYDGSNRKDFWEWNQSTNVWTQKADYGGGTVREAVGFSIGTKGYIGTGNDGTYSKQFWEWDQATNVWTQKTNFAGNGRYGAVGFSIGTKGYIGTGYSSSGLASDFWEWDQATNAWTAKANFPGTAREFAVGFAISTKGYIGTGNDGALKQDFYEWNQATNAWTSKASFPGDARKWAAGFSIGTKGYIGTGYNGSAYKQDLYEWDQTLNSWVAKANFTGVIRYGAVGFSIGTTKGYIGLGYGTGGYQKDFYEWDQAGNTWTQKADFLPTETQDAVGFGTSAYGYIGTGTNNNANRNILLKWNQSTNAWGQVTTFAGSARFQAAGFSIGTKGYIGTGYDGSFKTDFWEYDETANTWTQKANVGGVGRDRAIAFSIGTKGYIGLGWSGSAYLLDLWEYDQATNTWTAKANFIGTGRYDAVAFSIGTKGYVGTGYNGGTYYNDFWEWNQATNVWTSKANFGGVARAYAVGFSIGGNKGYIGTGQNSSGSKLQDFWEYNPTTNAWTAKANFTGTSRLEAAGFSIGNYGYIAGGNDGLTRKDFWEYNRCGTFSVSVTQTNVSCNGGTNGSISLTPSGGGIPYSYSWSTGATTQNISNLSSATYTVAITDDNGCTVTSSIVISQPAALTATASMTQSVTCNGGNNGSASVTAGGGTTPYTFSWTGGQTTSSATGLTSGNYTATVTDSKGCTKTATVAITQPSALSLPTPTKTNVTCYGACDATATANPSGGTSPYTYSWTTTPVQTTQTATGMCVGSKSVTVTDANGCSITKGVTLTQPGALSTTVTATQTVSCNGGNNGSASVSASSGTSPYTYSWSNGQTTTTATGLVAATYTATVTDANGCVKTGTVSISQPAVLSGSITPTNVTCNALCNGSALGNPTGGTTPYTYSWSTIPTQTTQTATGLCAGTYSGTVTDANGCIKTTTVSITQPAVLTASISATQTVSCNGGNNGSSTVTAGGGTTPYSYSWTNGQTTSVATALSSGTYSVTVTDFKGCMKTTSVTISQPGTALSATITASVNVSCYGGSNGSATVTAGGGTPAYTYLWNPSGKTTSTATGLSQGTYTVTVSDKNACTKTATVAITQPIAPLTTTTSVTDVLCNGQSNGSASVFPSGGTSPYTYSWSGGQTTSSIASQPAGAVTYTVTDNKGCTVSQTLTISQPAVLALTKTSQNVSCNGGGNGSIDLTVSGGTSPFTYNWSHGPTTEDVTGLTANSYNVLVTDANGCTATLPLSVTITEPAVLAAVKSKNDATCGGVCDGNATVTPSGGTSPYTYSWDDSQSQITQTAIGLCAGVYNVLISDANNCQITKNFTITQPTAVTVSVSTSPASCGMADGSASATVSGGSAPYTYSWSTGGTTSAISSVPAGVYTLTVTDGSANSCQAIVFANINSASTFTSTATQVDVSCNGGNNGSIDLTPSNGTPTYTYSWSNGTTTEDISGLVAGNYNVTVTDANTCVTANSFIVTEPAVLASSANSFSVACNGSSTASIDLTISGGTSPYIYSWSNGASTQDITNIAANTYSVLVTDSKGCTTTNTVVISEPSAFSNSALTTSVTCNGGSDGAVDISPSGGTTPYTFAWSTTDASEDISGLVSGTYSVLITDGNGCTYTYTYNIAQPGAVAATVTVTNVSCNGGNNGSATSNVSVGISPFTYQWDAFANSQTTQTATGLSQGTYSVTVTDNNGCTGVFSASVSEPAILSSTITPTNVTCNGLSNGSVNLTVVGGTSPYTFQWSGGSTATTQNLSGVSANNYSVTITDNKGCVTVNSVVVTQPNVLSASINKTDITCNGLCNGTATVTVTGGTTPYIYSWSNGSSTTTATGLCAISYNVTVQDNNGCQNTPNVTITQPLALTASLTATAATCSNNGTVSASVNGGTTPYTFSWSGGETTQNILALSSGGYSLTVTDVNGCTVASSASVTASPLTCSVSSTDVNCYGQGNGSASATASGGITPYAYSWAPSGGNSSSENNLSAGNYTVTISDASGCVQTLTVSVNEPAFLVANVSLTDVTCNGLCDGTAISNPTGGNPPYQYAWSSPLQTTQTATGLCPGNYNLTLTDNKGCSTTPNVSISEPPAMGVTLTSVNSTCGNLDGSASSYPSGGTTPYTYSWSNAETTQDITGLTAGTFSIIVTDANGCSISGSISLSDTTIGVDICMVTVDSTSTKNIIVWEKPTSTIIDSFRIYRDISSVYTYIGSVPYSSQSTFTDTTNGVNPNFTSYRYKISAVDTCGMESDTSSYHKTVLLQVSPALPSGYALDWDDYLGMTVTKYRILRDTTGTGNWQAIDSVGFAITSYTDPIQWDTVNYVIEIDHPAGCNISVKNPELMASNLNSSRSNIYRIGDSTATSVNENLKEELHVLIYPNPSSGIFTIEVKEKNTSIKIFNMLGDEVRRMNAISNKEKTLVDISGYSKGMYYIQVLNGKNIITKKIIIE